MGTKRDLVVRLLAKNSHFLRPRINLFSSKFFSGRGDLFRGDAAGGVARRQDECGAVGGFKVGGKTHHIFFNFSLLSSRNAPPI